jgi:hypothetical protein
MSSSAERIPIVILEDELSATTRTTKTAEVNHDDPASICEETTQAAALVITDDVEDNQHRVWSQAVQDQDNVVVLATDITRHDLGGDQNQHKQQSVNVTNYVESRDAEATPPRDEPVVVPAAAAAARRRRRRLIPVRRRSQSSVLVCLLGAFLVIVACLVVTGTLVSIHRFDLEDWREAIGSRNESSAPSSTLNDSDWPTPGPIYNHSSSEGGHRS